MGKRKRRFPVWLVVIVLLPVVLIYAGQSLSARSAQEALGQTEQAIRRAAVECYALEGFYPADLDYLVEHYGVEPNRDRYMIDYRFVASNLVPDVTVLPLE